MALLAACLLVFSCAAKDQIFQQLSPIPEEGICRIAVLPPLNKTIYPEGDVLFYRVLQNNLSQQTEMIVSQEGDVRKQYHELQLRYDAVPTYEELRIIAGRLGVHALILSEINRMQEVTKGDYFFPVLTGTIKLIDARTGTTIWFSYFSSEGEQYRKVMHFGLVNTMTKLVGIATQEVIDTWLEKGLGECRD